MVLTVNIDVTSHYAPTRLQNFDNARCNIGSSEGDCHLITNRNPWDTPFYFTFTISFS